MDTSGFSEELIQKAIEIWREQFACTISREAAIQTLRALAETAETLGTWEIPGDPNHPKGKEND